MPKPIRGRNDPSAPGPIAVPVPQAPKKVVLDAIADQVEAQLLAQVNKLLPYRGSGQEQGSEAGGPYVNDRRDALSLLRARHSRQALEEILPRSRGHLPSALRKDLDWIERADWQSLSLDRPFDLSWSLNPMSPPQVLKAAAALRKRDAQASLQALAEDPSRPYDASNDNLLPALLVDSSELRAQLLSDILIQLRAKRRSAALADGALEAHNGSRTAGRIATSGTLAVLEQRLACASLHKPKGLAGEREFALARLVVADHGPGSVNGIFSARNNVGELLDYLGYQIMAEPIGEGPGLGMSFFDAIHKNYSANTPNAVDHYLRQRVFTDGALGDRVQILSALVAAASSEDRASAVATLAELEARTGYALKAVAQAETQKGLRTLIVRHLGAHCDLSSLKRGLSETDKLHAYRRLITVHKAVCQDRPTADDLAHELFYAGKAWRPVAGLIHALRAGGPAEQVEALGAARLALRKAFFATDSGFERQMLLRLDRKVELISAEVLGQAVSQIQEANEPAALGPCLLAVRSALRGVVASGLGSLRAREPKGPAASVDALLAEADALLAGAPSADDLRSFFARVFRGASEVADSTRAYLRTREKALHFSDLDLSLDPAFADNLIKETPLHYLLGLAQAGMSHGLKAEVTAERISGISGMRVLSAVGPTVYKRVLIAKDMDELRRFRPGPDDYCLVHHLDEKRMKMMALGGLLADSKDAPGGYSHLSVFAKGHAISALALPKLRTAYRDFFKNVGKGGGLYVDDRPGSFVMMPLDAAIRSGLVDADKVDAMRPGTNKIVRYLERDGEIEKLIAEDHIARSPARPTDTIELYVPELSNKAGLPGVLSFAALREQPFEATRHLAGEKGAVLAALDGLPELKALGVEVPGGASIAPYQIAELLKAVPSGKGTLYDRWIELSGPELGARPPAERKKLLSEMQRALRQGLGKLLTSDGKPSQEGRALLTQLGKNPALGKGAWIARSSFTGEDRPYKSGAGQYESFPGLRTPADKLKGIIGVIESAFAESPIDNNLSLGIDLSKIWPSVLVQRCLKPSVSGVAVSRGGGGELGQVSYQAVPGFGGGVGAGHPEEGVLGEDSNRLERPLAGKKASLLTPAQQTQLRKAVLAIERAFQKTIEPGRGFAVDVEWAIEKGKLYVVQARVLVGA